MIRLGIKIQITFCSWIQTCLTWTLTRNFINLHGLDITMTISCIFACHMFTLSLFGPENLLAVTSNMYLLPGLRLKGLMLSRGVEIPGQMDKETGTT